MEGLASLNQTLLRGIPSYQQVFGGLAHFSAPLTLLAFIKNVTLLKPSLDLSCTGRGFTPCTTCPGTIDLLTCGGTYTSIMAQKLDGKLISMNSLRIAVQVFMDRILSTDKAL